jgi:phosphoribosylanthranilate isomerase/indole-3-glycerol phosphate synthase/phosphoribosylanthranilate isomerase
MMYKNIPQIKICGLTSVEMAIQCVEAGADAIGCVFYPKSPRNISDAQAKEICAALPPEVVSVGVFVNETFEFIMDKVKFCGLKAVQLHGKEPPELVSRLHQENLSVIKGLYIEGNPSTEQASSYKDAAAFLIECSRGKLPGGNAKAWNWRLAGGLKTDYPVILAGGLTPDNVSHAIAAALPDAVDVSSGVESAPGQKDIVKVRAFMEAVLQYEMNRKPKRIF